MKMDPDGQPLGDRSPKSGLPIGSQSPMNLGYGALGLSCVLGSVPPLAPGLVGAVRAETVG